MKDFISKKGIYIAVAAIVIALVASVSVALSGSSGFAALLSEPFFKPVKGAVTSLVNSLEHVYAYIYRYDELVAENEELRKRVAQLEDDYREYTEISEENARLKALLGFVEPHEDMDLVQVSVISWTASNFSSSFNISKGSSSGVELYDAVVDSNGYLVGQVTALTSSSATVTTIIDTASHIGAMIYENGETGVVSGDFELMRRGLLKLSYLAADSSLIIGNTVVTSGGSGAFPSGLVIGKISGISAGTSGLDAYAMVQPSADIEGSAHLYVVTDFAYSE